MMETTTPPIISPFTRVGPAIVAAIVLCLYGLYRLALPKPIPGIPYNVPSSRKILGDVQGITAHMGQTDGGTFITYILETMKKLDAPLIQVFIRPFSKPLLILGDFREAHDMLVRRREFDRSYTLGDLVQGLAPDHHIHLKTDAAWKSQRRLVQDLMTPSFLHQVAGPAIYQNVNTMIELWQAKSRVAGGRPWKAGEDINQMALDAVTAFAFGDGFQHSATRPALEQVERMSQEELRKIESLRIDDPVSFPKGRIGTELQSTLELTGTVGEVQGNPIPWLTWYFVTRRPKIKRAIKVKEDYIKKELEDGLERYRRTQGQKIESAVDQMIYREMNLAKKDGRSPDVFSRIMIDEIFGFIFAGHETTSTTLCWGLKYLADTPDAQNALRAALRQAFPDAASREENPSIQDITSARIPYLDAAIEETLRCAGTAPVVDRVATEDTQLLGHHVPKGTVITCLVTGPSMKSPGFEVEDARRSESSRAAIKEGRDRSWDASDISVYKPERWLVQRPGETSPEFDASMGPQLAFGLGTRGCYGKRLVYLEMRVVLTLIVWNFELMSCPPKLSGYQAKLITTNEPQNCYVRLRRLST